jgi:hypothetical protein
MANYLLTTYVAGGSGSIVQWGGSYNAASECVGQYVGPLEELSSCSAYYPSVRTSVVTAKPDTDNGWVLSRWELRRSDTGEVISNNFILDPDESDSLGRHVTLSNFDIDLVVYFSHPDVSLILEPAENEDSVRGSVKLVNPYGPSYDNSSHRSSFSQLLPVETIIGNPTTVVEANPDNGWQVQKWTVDGVDQETDEEQITISLNVPSSSVEVKVYFEEYVPCTTNYLNVSVAGNGSVNIPSGNYCDDQTLSLKPLPAYGYFFKEWVYDTFSSISLDGITLNVPMDSNRNVTAVFEALSYFEFPQADLFYCPSTTNRDSVVSFDFTNDGSNPSAGDDYHFRINFYTDSFKTKLIYSAFSLADNKRWFINDSIFSPFSENGETTEVGESMNVIYDPEVLPQLDSEEQMGKSINSDNYEIPLICGVKYYIDIESYSVATSSFTFLKTMTLILDCNTLDSHLWGKNNEKWECSGQGKTDLQVSISTTSQSIMSSVDSNRSGLYQIVWQTRRGERNEIYGAIWDSNQDYFYSSGQGNYDELKLIGGYSPIVFKEQSDNFYISSHGTIRETSGDITNKIYSFACPLPVSIEGSPIETEDEAFAKVCSPGITEYLGTSYDQIKVRVRESDICSSLVINFDKVVPVVNKQFINIDVDGIAGAYAVRLRNGDDEKWGGWINIDNNLYYNGISSNDFITSEDSLYNAYRIDNSRFIVPWNVSRVNGLKRICVQVLTSYGITNVYCIEVFFNLEVPRYVFEFYVDEACTIPFPTNNGKYILSIKSVSDGQAVIDSTKETITVYFKVVFSSPIYKNEITKTLYSDGDLTFNVVKQGLDDYWGGNLSVESSSVYKGSFPITREDGIFNKDGDSFIEIIFDRVLQDSRIATDSLDKYNLMLTEEEASEYKDMTPEEVYNKILTNRANKVFDINNFKQNYEQDDSNFEFGNPGYFRG